MTDISGQLLGPIKGQARLNLEDGNIGFAETSVAQSRTAYQKSENFSHEIVLTSLNHNQSAE
jgi:hypothetical protein